MTQPELSILCPLNPNDVGGHNVPALFSEGYFSIVKGSGGPKFLDFS